jgi:Fe-S cluster biogenesis protein NfuA
MTDAALEPALDEVRSIIQADGGDILLTSVDSGTVHLQLVVEGASCAECILPRELLEQVTLDIMQRGGTGVTAIKIDDPRERPDYVAADH